MKRNFVVSVFGSLVGFVMLFILLSAAGIAGARSNDVIRSDVSQVNSVTAATVTSTFTYQGQLINGGSSVSNICDFQFGLYDALSAGNRIGITQTVSSVSVSRGLFTALLNVGNEFGDTAFNGDARWLSIAVRCPTGGAYTTLIPRQQLTSLPFALPGLRTIPNATSPNVIGGYSGNVISPTVSASAIGGGGMQSVPNRVWADYATISGGLNNIASGKGAFIGGGFCNRAGTYLSGFCLGFWQSGDDTTVAGGFGNRASGYAASIGGGYDNTASGDFATVPGGLRNSATMSYTFAAGYRAQANHQGAFVWADSTNADFASTANDQFLIRANGGVGINTNSPAAGTLDVNGDVIVRGADFIVKGRGGGQGNSGGAARALVDAGWGGSAVAGGGLYINFANDYGKVTVGSDLTIEGNVIIPTLGAAGGSSLCLNGSQQIAMCSSSLRYKNNIANLNLGLGIVAKLHPVTFNWKDSGQADLGFVAEEVNQVTPLLTTLNKDGHIEGVKYDRIGAVLVKAMQEQQAQIATLKTQNADLTARLSKLEQDTTASNPVAQPESFNASNLLSAIALIVVGRMWLQQRRSTHGGRA